MEVDVSPAQVASPLGLLPLGWELLRVKAITTKVGSGATPKGGQEVYLPSRTNFALIRSQNVFDRRFDRTGLAFISDRHADELAGAKVQEGDILLNITGDGVTFGRACIAPRSVLPACVNQHVSIIRVNRGKCDPGYLLSYLTHPLVKSYIESFNAGGSRRAVTKGHIESFEVALPPIPVQQAIAKALGSLDEKIELNRRMNETLEEMARAMFRSWFVDFDPVRAKVDGRMPEGMDAATAKLFPSKFEDSVVGPVPKGWQVVSLGDHVEVAKGLSYKGEGLAEAGVALHNLNSVYEGGGYKHEGIKHYVGEYRPCHVIHAGDVIVTNTEQGHDHLLIGYSALIPKRYGDLGLFSHHTYRVRPLPDSPLTPPFIHHLLLTSRFRGEVIGFTNGTTVNMLPAEGLKRPRLVLPPAELIRRFTDFVTPLIDKAEANYEESRSLTVTRDALLPKLLSGEVTPC